MSMSMNALGIMSYDGPAVAINVAINIGAGTITNRRWNDNNQRAEQARMRLL